MSQADLVAEIALLKDEAKLLRDSGDYVAAIDVLAQAVDLIDGTQWEQGLSPGAPLTETERKFAWHLADCLGMLGGNHRRNDQLADAVRCFERGATYEGDARYLISSTYNTVNAIVAPVEGGLRDAASQKPALEKAVATLKRQIFDPEMLTASRRLDRWAWADLGQCLLLLGDIDAARAAHARFVELSEPSAIRSCRDVLSRLHAALQARRDPMANAVAAGIDYLQSSLAPASPPAH